MMFDGLDDYEVEHRAAAPPIAGAADTERAARLDAERVTWEFKQRSTRRLDSGKRPMEESPLFGGDTQADMFAGDIK